LLLLLFCMLRVSSCRSGCMLLLVEVRLMHLLLVRLFVLLFRALPRSRGD